MPFERVTKFLQHLKKVGQPQKAEVDPREMLWSKDAVADELAKVMQRFSDEPQKRLAAARALACGGVDSEEPEAAAHRSSRIAALPASH